MMYKTRLFTLSLLFLFIFQSVFILTPARADEEKDYYLRLKRSWQYMQRVYEHLSKHYVEEIDPYPLIKAGIDGMLDQLDPYTVFIEQEGERRLRMITTGKYGGLGMEIGLRDKKVTVISPIDNSPAKRMGVLAGDIIEKIDDQSVQSWSIDEVSSKLRGKIGTKVKLVIRRPGLADPIELNMTREEIVIQDVGFAGFLKPGIAYVNLSGFTDKAASELTATIKKLQKEAQIQSFILDLRGNPGGLLEAAVDVVNIFVPKGELVVYTHGYREEPHKFYTTRQPLLPDVPLVVLVDGGSASASEIVAGAFQDLDRAVIVGEPTFGKGLVQKVYSVDNNRDAKLKITTAKYYVPSGRCIQKQDYGFHNKVIVRDSSKSEDNGSSAFYTKNKRKVFDKGGIYPDVQVKSDSVNYILVDLIRKSLLFDFAVQFHHHNPDWAEDFMFSDSILSAFNHYLKEKDYQFESPLGREFKRIKTLARKKHRSDEFLSLLDQVDTKINQQKETDLQNSMPQIQKYLRLELAEKYLGRRERDRLSLQDDAPVLEALDLLSNSNRYSSILAIK